MLNAHIVEKLCQGDGLIRKDLQQRAERVALVPARKPMIGDPFRTNRAGCCGALVGIASAFSTKLKNGTRLLVAEELNCRGHLRIFFPSCL